MTIRAPITAPTLRPGQVQYYSEYKVGQGIIGEIMPLGPGLSSVATLRRLISHALKSMYPINKQMAAMYGPMYAWLDSGGGGGSRRVHLWAPRSWIRALALVCRRTEHGSTSVGPQWTPMGPLTWIQSSIHGPVMVEQLSWIRFLPTVC